jgi:hypothetical protein
MSDVTITPPAQRVLVLAILAAVAALSAAQLPEIQRYLRIRSM